MSPSAATTPARSSVAAGPVPGGDVEVGLAAGMARHALPLLPVVALGGAIIGGLTGSWSAAVGLLLVVANVVGAARIAKWAASVSPGALYGAALGGYVVRLGLITGFVFVVRDQVDIVALGLSIVVSQLTLLVWEVRSLAGHAQSSERSELARQGGAAR